MKKILVFLATVWLFCTGQPAQAGVRFGIPLPFPFLVWTPSSHCGQGNHGSCAPQGQDRTTAIPKSAVTHPRAATVRTRLDSAPKAIS